MMPSPIAPEMRAAFDELLARCATLDEWCAFARHLEVAVHERQRLVLAIKNLISRHEGEGDPEIDDLQGVLAEVTADFRAIDALRRDTATAIDALRSRSTRELKPVRSRS